MGLISPICLHFGAIGEGADELMELAGEIKMNEVGVRACRPITAVLS